MLALFGLGNSKPLKLRDLRLRIINHVDDPLLYGVKTNAYFPIPTSTTGAQLKSRIEGKLGIPVERQYLFFCGSLLKDKQLIPEEAFEPFEAINLDDEVFRPRIYLLLKKQETVVEANSDVLVVHRVEVDEEAEEAKRQQEAMRLEAERLAKERQLLIMQLRLARDAEKEFHFDLQDELIPINCSSFFEVLRDNGYDDMVSTLLICYSQINYCVLLR